VLENKLAESAKTESKARLGLRFLDKILSCSSADEFDTLSFSR
jgi:hypothetical protein